MDNSETSCPIFLVRQHKNMITLIPKIGVNIAQILKIENDFVQVAWRLRVFLVVL